MTLYAEGHRRLRPALNGFIRKATVGNQPSIKVILCGSWSDAIKQCAKDPGSWLLIDSEGELSDHIRNEVQAQLHPSNHAFFMVQLMEAWFLADRTTLADYYGQEFNASRLPSNTNIEAIPKHDVEDGLREATRRCRKGAYNKGTHSPELLRRLDAAAVYNACPNFARLIDSLP